jgi:hypothetical protein
MKGEIPNFFKKRFESEVDYYIHRFGILCYEYLGAVLWRILDVLADECVDEEYDDLAILEFISVINAIKNAEKK